MLVTSYGESIACSFLPEKCECCDPSGQGFLEALRSMPRLRSVTVDYHTQNSEFRRFRDWLHTHHHDAELHCIELGVYQLSESFMNGINLSFQHLPVAKIWPRLLALSEESPSEVREEEALAELRQIQGDVPDKLWLLVCARKLNATSFGEMGTWFDEVDTRNMTLPERSDAMHLFTDALQQHLDRESAAGSRRYLRTIREMQLIGL